MSESSGALHTDLPTGKLPFGYCSVAVDQRGRPAGPDQGSGFESGAPFSEPSAGEVELEPCGVPGAHGFRDAGGRPVVEEVYEWAEGPSLMGAGVAMLHPEEPDAGRWGVLRSDGTFIRSTHPEPLVTDDGAVLGFADGDGLAPFRTADGATAYLDTNDREVCRVRVAAADGSILQLLDANGEEAWWYEGEPGMFTRQPAFLEAGPEENFLVPEAWTGDVVALAGRLLDAEPRLFLPDTAYDEPTTPATSATRTRHAMGQ